MRREWAATPAGSGSGQGQGQGWDWTGLGQGQGWDGPDLAEEEGGLAAHGHPLQLGAVHDRAHQVRHLARGDYRPRLDLVLEGRTGPS